MSLADSLRGGRLTYRDGIPSHRSSGENYQIKPGTDSKTLAKATVQAKYLGVPPTNEGRNQRERTLCYVILINEAAASSRTTRPAPRPTERKVLESYQGFVVKVEGPWSHVTLRTDQGEEFVGTYPTAELAARGVGERDRFSLATVERGDAVLFEIHLLPRHEVSAVEQQAIREQIEHDLGDYSPGDDY